MTIKTNRTSVLRMPRLGETMEQGQIVSWLIKPGQKFERGQALVELETDKTIVELPALGAGVLTEILVPEGKTVRVSEPIAHVDVGGGPDWTLEGEARDEAAETVQDSTNVHSANLHDINLESAKTSLEAKSNGSAVNKSSMSSTVRQRATPAARRLARVKGIVLADVPGTGRRGRVETTDVRSFSSRGASSAFASSRNKKINYLHEIAYAEYGPTNGVPMLFIHGYSGDHTTYANLANLLKKASCRVVSIDLPGHGATRLEATSPEDLATNLDAFAKDIFPSKPFHVVAHSLGAVPALLLAEKMVLASITLIAPAGLGPSIDAVFVDGMANATSAGEIAHLLRRLTDMPSTLSESAIADIYYNSSQGRLKRLAQTLHGPAGQTVSIRSTLERISTNIPVRILLGHRDRIFDWQEALELSPRIALHHFARASHMPHWEFPSDVAEIIVKASHLG